MASKKSAGSDHAILRAGVSWRTNASTGGGSKCVVEMRPPQSKWKLHFGSYDTEFEAMAARDYAALLRVSAGEDATTAGGFHYHSNLCEFDESHVIFKSKDVFTVRCAEYKRLLEENRKENCANSPRNSPFKEFCKEARKDIANSIEEFRRRYLHCKLQPATKDLPKLDGGTHFTPPSSSFEGYFGSYSVEPCHEGLKMQDDDGIVPGFNSSYNESYNAQPTLFKSVVTSNCDQSPSITYSGVADSSLSAGTSVEEEMELYCYNRNNFCQEMTLIDEYLAEGEGDISLKETEIEEYFAEGEADQLQLDLSSHVDVADHDGNGAGDFLKNDIYQLLHDAIEDQIQMDIDETDIPMHCRRTISHEEALLVSQLETQNTKLKIVQAQLEIVVQQKNKLKIANWRMAKDDGVISNEEYIQQVKALLDL